MAEKIYKRDDGSQVKIVSHKSNYDYNRYNIRVYTRIPPKRTWIEINFGDDSNYRRLPMEEKSQYKFDKILSYVTYEEIHEVQMLCWQEFKPNFDNIPNEIIL